MQKKDKWYDKSFRINSLVDKCLRDFTKMFGTHLNIRNKKSWCAGWCDGEEEGVVVFTQCPATGERLSIQEVIGAVLHEIAHIESSRRGVYQSYSNEQYSNFKYITTRHLKNIIRTGYRAEIYCDKIARELQRDYFPGIPYLAGYHTNNKDDIKWYHDNYLNQYKNELYRRQRRKQ